MPVCFLVTKDEKILWEKEIQIVNLDELDEIINITIQELEDIFGWTFTVKRLGSIKEASHLIDETNNVHLRIFLKQFSTLIDYKKEGWFYGLSEDSAYLSIE